MITTFFEDFLRFLREDIPFWDLTSELLIPEDIDVRAEVIAEEDGVVAFTEELSSFLKGMGIKTRFIRSGSRIRDGDVIMELRGKARRILLVERTALNLLARACGIATKTARVVEKVRKINPRVRIACTRKTTPGLRYLEKRAVMAGGGDTHRLSLSDMVLIKDNHLAIVGGVEEALRRAKNAGFAFKVEVEVSTPEEAVKAAEAGADVVMLDNFRPEEVERALSMLKAEGLREKVLIEVSGGIGEDNVIDYAKFDVDVISMGELTCGARPLKMSLEVREVIR